MLSAAEREYPLIYWHDDVMKFNYCNVLLWSFFQKNTKQNI